MKNTFIVFINNLLANEIFIYVEKKKPNITCPSEESEVNGSCKCGNADSCLNNKDGLNICDPNNSQCVCSKGGTSCKKEENCIREKCSRKFFDE